MFIAPGPAHLLTTPSRSSAVPRQEYPLRPFRFLLVSVVVLAPRWAHAQASVPVIPLPASVISGTGAWTPAGPLPSDLAYAGDAALTAAGIRVQLTPADAARGPESYRLTVSPAGVELTAPTAAGRFYGLHTLQQLVDAGRTGAGATEVPAVTIADAPRFPYRGLHLDVSRHFQPVDFVKRYIDLMARYKLNTFHWHLTDDQGWRIEIKRYPRLTEVGSCRTETMLEKNFEPYVGDGVPDCGFYTQDEIRDVVRYATARHVTVIPEIEMPGHSVAALTAYPELACTDGPFEVRRTWGVSDDILCPGEPTFAFLEGVLTEVIALFPSRYVHIGGDEAPKTRWEASPLAQEVIRREHLKDAHELQSWFIRRMERWLIAHDRRLIGWDEILEGGLAPQATVMSWRGIDGGIEAARAGHDVIMTPTSNLYFDYYQGDDRFEPLAIGGLVTLERVYAYDPVPDVLTASEAKHILGAQGNVWTEYLKTPASIEYMAFPRVLALAELTWTPQERRDWPGFQARLPFALRTLGRLGVNYRMPHVVGLETDVLTLEPRLLVPLSVPIADAEIHYTVDGTDPTRTSPRYTAPIDLRTTFEGVRITARAFTANGKASPPRAASFRRTNYREAEGMQAALLALGLRAAYYEATVRTTAEIDSLSPTRRAVVLGVSRQGDERPEQYALRFDGFLDVPEDALYEFALSSDDGSTLTIGGVVVVDNDGFHGPAEKTGMIALRAGAHPLTVRFFQGGGGAALSLRVRRGAEPWQEVPSSWLMHLP